MKMASLLLALIMASGQATGAGAFTGTPGISALHPSLYQIRLGSCRRLALLVGRGVLPSGGHAGRQGEGLAGVAMQIKVQNDKKRDSDGFQRWWDPAWRSLRVSELKVSLCPLHRPTPSSAVPCRRFCLCRLCPRVPLCVRAYLNRESEGRCMWCAVNSDRGFCWIMLEARTHAAPLSGMTPGMAAQSLASMSDKKIFARRHA